MTSEITREVGAPAAAELEFTGKLTGGEMRRWTRSIGWRMAARLYAKFAIVPMAVILIVSAINNKNGVDTWLRSLAAPLTVVNMFASLFIAWKLISLLTKAGKYRELSQPETTVRFYPDKVEIVTSQGLINQFPYTLLLFEKTSFGLTCETKGRVPVFMLPNRVLPIDEANRIVTLAKAATV